MQLQPLGTDAGHIKAGFLGLQGSGKTYTAMELAIGAREHFGLDGPIAMQDTERGSEYLSRRVKTATGKDLVGVKSRNLDDSVDFLNSCLTLGVSVALIDSITHIWRELCNSYLEQINRNRKAESKPPRTRLAFADWNVIKPRWARLTDLFLNIPLHVIVCGREGYEWDWEQDEETGKSELKKTAVKLKAEGEFGYEPALLVRMQRFQVNADGILTHRATIMKDKFPESGLDGKAFDDPTFSTFLPHIQLLTPGAHGPVDTISETDFAIGPDGNAEWHREKKARTVALEEAQALLVRAYPGMSAVDKKAKAEIIHAAFGTGSWTGLEGWKAEDLGPIVDNLPMVIEKYRREHETEAKPSKSKKTMAKGGK